ncbi:hypothetical protein D3C86_1576280 [compost metagenome]
MQIQAETGQRHQQGHDQRQPAAQHATRAFGLLGIGQQLAGGLAAAGIQLGGIQRAGGMLGVQFGDALLIQGDVEGGAVFLGLDTTATQQRNQHKGERCQQQHSGGKPESGHLSALVLSTELWSPEFL